MDRDREHEANRCNSPTSSAVSFAKELISTIAKHPSEPFCSPLSKINGSPSARWSIRWIEWGKTFESLLHQMKFCGGGRFLFARRGPRARISPFSQITEQMLTQFRRLIERYSVFRKCWLEYTMSEKLGAAPVRSLFFFRAESLRITGRQVRNSMRNTRSRLFAREFIFIFTSSELTIRR